MNLSENIFDARLVHGVTSRDEYIVKHRYAIAIVGRTTWRAPGPLMMGVEHGRYIADCKHCSRPLSGSKEWEMALCFTCGAHYEGKDICWPPIDVERELLKRPVLASDFFIPVNRNWRWGEPILDLVADNIEHGVA